MAWSPWLHSLTVTISSHNISLQTSALNKVFVAKDWQSHICGQWEVNAHFQVWIIPKLCCPLLIQVGFVAKYLDHWQLMYILCLFHSRSHNIASYLHLIQNQEEESHTKFYCSRGMLLGNKINAQRFALHSKHNSFYGSNMENMERYGERLTPRAESNPALASWIPNALLGVSGGVVSWSFIFVSEGLWGSFLSFSTPSNVCKVASIVDCLSYFLHLALNAESCLD